MTDQGKPNPSERPMGVRILDLLFLLRLSGNLMFRDVLQLKEIEIRLISALGCDGPMPSLKIANHLGISKSQTSHTTKALTEAALIKRTHHRAPFKLTKKGNRKYAMAAEISTLRQTQLTEGLSGEDLQFFYAVIEQLTEYGKLWLAREQSKAVDNSLAGEQFLKPASGDETTADALIPKILKMSVLMQRATFLQWKRVVGISPVNWVMLSRVAEHERLRFAELVFLSARDAGQVSRTVSGLVQNGLLRRTDKGGRRDFELQATDKGKEIYTRTAQISDEHERIFREELGIERQQRFKGLIELMIPNADRMANPPAKIP